MNRSLLSFFAILLCQQFNIAGAQVDRVQNYRNTNAQSSSIQSLIKKEIKFAHCVRTLIERGGKNIDEFNKVLNYLEQLNLSKDDQLDSELEKCKSESNKYISLTSITTREKMKFIQSNKNFIKPELYTLVSQIITPKVDCTRAGLDARVALIIGLSVRAEGSYCTSTTGRKWFEVRGGAAFLKGIAGFAGIQGGTDNVYRMNRRIPVHITPYQYGAGGFAAAVFSGPEFGSRYSETLGIGAGVGIAEGNGFSLNVRLLPLGTDNSYLVNLVLNSLKG